METIIAGLLNDFEKGRMTRRQLIQSLALVAAAAAPGSVAAQSAPAKAAPIPRAFEPTGWKTVWLDHISYAVSDYRRSTAFYRDLMGWEIKNDNGTSQCTLNINGIGGIIIRNNRGGAGREGSEGRQGGSANASAGAGAGAGAGAAAGAGSGANASVAAGAQGGGRGNRPPLTGVINHVSWGMSPWDTDKVKAELERRGLNPRPDMVGDNFKSFHVFDPDGWDLQISNQTKDTQS
jgi:catechol 2,3-dioxygenase-like lactoylglutathione lyase family enzyme